MTTKLDLVYDKDNSVKQANTECQYLHLEKISDVEIIVTIIDKEDQQITFRINSIKSKKRGDISCNVEFQNEEMKHESFPFAEGGKSNSLVECIESK